jgi:predicted nucleic acid-binding protein
MGSLNAIVGPDVYIDANTLIYQVEGLSGFGPILARVFDEFDRGRWTAVMSELTWGEVIVKPLRVGDMRIKAAYEQALLRSGARLIQITRDIIVDAAGIRAGTNIKLPDAIHAATALREHCTTFVTNDRGFLSVPGLPVALLSDLLGKWP